MLLAARFCNWSSLLAEAILNFLMDSDDGYRGGWWWDLAAMQSWVLHCTKYKSMSLLNNEFNLLLNILYCTWLHIHGLTYILFTTFCCIFIFFLWLMQLSRCWIRSNLRWARFGNKTHITAHITQLSLMLTTHRNFNKTLIRPISMSWQIQITFSPLHCMHYSSLQNKKEFSHFRLNLGPHS